MSDRFSPHRISRAFWLAGVGSLALTAAAAAKDLPATSDGAAGIVSTLGAYIGKSSSALTVTPEGTDYLVSVDIAALAAGLKSAGLVYETAPMTFKLFQQDDGKWRVERHDFSPVKASQMKNGATIEALVTGAGLNSVSVFDPALGGLSTGDTTLDSMNLRGHGPGVNEAVDASGLKVHSTGVKLGDAGVSITGGESLDNATFAFAADPKLVEPNKITEAKPVNISGKVGATTADVKIDSETFRSWLDVWKFLSAHPDKADLAANEAPYKALLTAALAGKTSADETFGAKSLTIQAPQGTIELHDVAMGFGLAADGVNSRFEQHFAASSLVLPPQLAPDNMRDLIPTSFDIGFKLTGFNLNAGATVAVANMHLAADAPQPTAMDSGKPLIRMLADGPVKLVVAPTHIVAPKLDVTLEGQGDYHLGAKISGKFIIHMRNFDQTVAAMKGLGEDQQKKLVPLLAMAKGLGKADGDTLAWEVEIGPDSTIKVNGLPLGKSPY